jgi:alcohol dehydrogenase (cytochrome c)
MSVRRWRWPAVALLLVAAAWLSMSGGLSSVSGSGADARTKVEQAIKWRAELVVLKAKGHVTDLSWAELWKMARARGGFGLAGLTTSGLSLEGSVVNPYLSDDDEASGQKLFHERCANCHGRDGTGWHGPPLNRPGLRHGDSDLAIYKAIRDGIRDTGMKAIDMTFVERWQLVGHIKRLQTRGATGAVQDEVGAKIDVMVPQERVRAAGSRTDEWVTYSGSQDGQRYSTLSQITPENVSRLRLLWSRQFDSNETKFEATPLVADGMMYLTVPPATVVALSAKTGRVAWTFTRDVPADLPVCCGRVTRGVAILDRTVFFGSLDGHLFALDANTGRTVWQTKVAESAAGHSITGAPLIVGRSVVVGVAGGEYPTRGYLVAFDATTGQQNWRFNTIPAPGEPGHETWKNDAWNTGGGATWNTGSYDPSLGLIYWGVGNPTPEFAGDVRPGDNLFTASVVALHAQTGKLAWYFQFTPHDEHDWDSAQTPILADLTINGLPRKAICWPNRNGFYYVLDRVSGEYLVGKPYVEQNWTQGLDEKGRPIPLAGSAVSSAGRLTRPGLAGGTNWQNPAFDRQRKLVFVPATEGASVFTQSAKPTRGEHGIYLGSSGTVLRPLDRIVRALDAATGERRWERVAPASNEFYLSYSGLLATGGGLVFGAARGTLFAIESATGREVWSVPLGGETFAAPITYTLEGRQVIALLAGRSLFTFAL